MNTTVNDPSEWLNAVREALDNDGVSRYRFARILENEGVCSRHSADCLLADEGTTLRGERVPNLQTALGMAHAAGYDVILRKRKGVR
jgi:hypothetical protein